MSIDRRYPIGTMQDALAGPLDYEACVASIGNFPATLHQTVAGLAPSQLSSQYREGSWDVRTLVHHCADSHVHAFVRIKLALTEDEPSVLAYNEGLTATLPDYEVDLEHTLHLLAGLHARLAHLLAHIQPKDRCRRYFHLGHKKTFTIEQTAAMYAWHGTHHLEHIRLALADHQVS